MTDRLTPERRSANMARIRDRDTKPEMIVRRLVHGMGYRYRLRKKDLPGKPDLVFGLRRKAIFVHGCFWHQHKDPECKIARLPKSRLDYWKPKLARNRERDEQHKGKLIALGWGVLEVWECQTKQGNLGELATLLQQFLDGQS